MAVRRPGTGELRGCRRSRSRARIDASERELDLVDMHGERLVNHCVTSHPYSGRVLHGVDRAGRSRP